MVDLSKTSATIGERAFKGAFSTDQSSNPTLLLGNNIFSSTSFKDSYMVTLDTGNVTNIPDNAFIGCYYIGKINVSNVEVIGTYAFCDTTNITPPLVFGDNLTTIGENAFKRLNYNYSTPFYQEYLVIPESVTDIGNYAIDLRSNALDNYTKGTNIKVLSTIPPTAGNYIFGSWYRSPAKIYVPAESVDTYKAASGWSSYAEYIEAIPEE